MHHFLKLLLLIPCFLFLGLFFSTPSHAALQSETFEFPGSYNAAAVGGSGVNTPFLVAIGKFPITIKNAQEITRSVNNRYVFKYHFWWRSTTTPVTLTEMTSGDFSETTSNGTRVVTTAIDPPPLTASTQIWDLCVFFGETPLDRGRQYELCEKSFPVILSGGSLQVGAVKINAPNLDRLDVTENSISITVKNAKDVSGKQKYNFWWKDLTTNRDIGTMQSGQYTFVKETDGTTTVTTSIPPPPKSLFESTPQVKPFALCSYYGEGNLADNARRGLICDTQVNVKFVYEVVKPRFSIKCEGANTNIYLKWDAIQGGGCQIWVKEVKPDGKENSALILNECKVDQTFNQTVLKDYKNPTNTILLDKDATYQVQAYTSPTLKFESDPIKPENCTALTGSFEKPKPTATEEPRLLPGFDAPALSISDTLKALFANDKTTLKYPTLGALLSAVYSVMFFFAGFLTFIWMVIGIFKYIMSGGKKEELAKARGQITWAIIGFLFITVAFALSQYIKDNIPGQKNIPIQNVSTPVSPLPIKP